MLAFLGGAALRYLLSQHRNGRKLLGCLGFSQAGKSHTPDANYCTGHIAYRHRRFARESVEVYVPPLFLHYSVYARKAPALKRAGAS
jgi:hypothetical protein